MKRLIGILIVFILMCAGIFIYLKQHSQGAQSAQTLIEFRKQSSYWFLLHRKANVEFLYIGKPGDMQKSTLVKKFIVKAGVPGERPTPLPELLGRKYWTVTDKMETSDNPETAPYFLTLDIPVSEEKPFGPTPYLECNGQCNWTLPGGFGLHGVNGDTTKLTTADPGSSGCIRHSDEDITYLYNLLNPEEQEIRYYIEDV